MGQMNGVNIEQLQGGLGRSGENTDSVFAYFSNEFSTLSTAQLHKLSSLFDAEQLGITPAFDTNISRGVHHEISEFFRLAPNGTLYLGRITKDDPQRLVNEIKVYLDQNSEIKGYGVVSDDVRVNEEFINENQAMINAYKAENRLIDFAILSHFNMEIPEGSMFSFSCPNVSVLISSSHPSLEPAMGSFLGMLAVRQVSENVGSVDILNKPLAKRGFPDYSLTDTVANRWITAQLIDGTSMDELPRPIFNQYKAAGFIMAAQYQGYPGFFFTGSETCVDRASDFGFIENNRVFNKAARIVRNTLLPRVKGKVKKDPSTGFIASTTTSYWESLLNKALESMIISNDISGFQVSIDNKQVVNDTNPVKIKLLIVLDDIAHEFEVAIGLTNSI